MRPCGWWSAATPGRRGARNWGRGSSRRHDLPVPVPAGAIPKDGPSAGVTMFPALTSLATGRKARPRVGMTGEITLSGRVLAIGGVKEKALAARRAGLREVIVP